MQKNSELKDSGGHFVELKNIEAAGLVSSSWHFLGGAIYNSFAPLPRYQAKSY